MSTTVQKAQDLADSMRMSRVSYEATWNEIAKYVLPDQIPDGVNAIDDTGKRALRILAQGMMSGLTSPAHPWFRIKLADRHGAENEPERNWLNIVESRIYASLARSNFYAALQIAYMELAAFGSANIYQEMDSKRLMRFTAVPCCGFTWARDPESGQVNTVVRHSTITAQQVAERYGEGKCSKRTRRLLRKKPEELVGITHMVRPRIQAARDASTFGPMNMPWESLVWETRTADCFLHEGGYEEFPHLIARWHTTSCKELYGYSPAMEIQRDIQKLEEVTRCQLHMVRKIVHPETPSKGTESWFGSIAKDDTGCILSRQRNEKDNIELYQIDPDIAAISREIEELRTSIRKGFYNDFFLAFIHEANPKTKQEMDARSEEVLHELSPVIERLQVELLDPLIERTYGMIRRASLLPTPPCCMEGKTLQVEYISPLAEAQNNLKTKRLCDFFMDAQKTFG